MANVVRFPARGADPPNPLEVWRGWRTWLRHADRAEDTIRGYTGSVLRFLAETDCLPLDQYRPAHCLDYLATFTPRGAARYQATKGVGAFFDWCVREGVISTSPMEGVESRKPRRRAPITLTEEELVRLLVATVFTQGERVAWCILLLYSLGLRRKEAAGLKWEHILDDEGGPVIEIHETKGADQREALPLSPLALECLAHLRELPSPPQVRLGPEYILRAGRATISDWVHVAGVAAELHPQKIGSHRLRASLATRLLRDGVDVTLVQQVLGHMHLESTAWYLGYATRDEVRAALSRPAVTRGRS